MSSCDNHFSKRREWGTAKCVKQNEVIIHFNNLNELNIYKTERRQTKTGLLEV